MIIVQLLGGLGNQLFQYALGFSLAKRTNAEFCLDTTAFKKYKLHKYSLHHLSVSAPEASAYDLFWLNGPFQKIKERICPSSDSRRVLEKTMTFEPSILDLKGSRYLSGYWQCEKYFSDVRDHLLKEFSVKTNASEENARCLEAIKTSKSISLHVRRADYVNNDSFPLCGLDYYERACAYMLECFENPTFYVFSDDPSWVKENLKIDATCKFIDHNNADANYEDFRLMMNCEHHVVANSSFSWWGAWLANTPDHVVVAPKRWWEPKIGNDCDVVPESWVRLS